MRATRCLPAPARRQRLQTVSRLRDAARSFARRPSHEVSDHEATNDSAADAPQPEGPDDEALSPSVRRLVKQYDLDVTGVRGSGPDGRLRVSDVMALIGGREGAAEPSSARPSRDTHAASTAGGETTAAADAGAHDAPAPGAYEPATTTVFECEAGRIVEDHRRRRERGHEIALSAYFVAAFAAALNETGAYGDGDAQRVPPLAVDSRHGVHVIADAHRLTLEQIAVALHAPPVAPAKPVLLVRHHGTSGSLLVEPASLERNQLGLLGIGRIRREVVVRTIDGDETPRIASRCLLTLSYREAGLGTHAANALLGRCVEHVEHWRVIE